MTRMIAAIAAALASAGCPTLDELVALRQELVEQLRWSLEHPSDLRLARERLERFL
jgi:hypothetical protein